MHLQICTKHQNQNSDLKYQNHKNQKIHQRGDYKSMTMIMGGEYHMVIE